MGSDDHEPVTMLDGVLFPSSGFVEGADASTDLSLDASVMGCLTIVLIRGESEFESFWTGCVSDSDTVEIGENCARAVAFCRARIVVLRDSTSSSVGARLNCTVTFCSRRLVSLSLD